MVMTWGRSYGKYQEMGTVREKTGELSVEKQQIILHPEP